MNGGALKLDPAVLEQLQAGLVAHRRGDLAQAEQLYRAVLATAPETLDAANLLARLLVQVGRAGEAVPLLRHALDRAPNQAGLWLSYTECLLAAGQVVPGREAAETAGFRSSAVAFPAGVVGTAAASRRPKFLATASTHGPTNHGPRKLRCSNS